MSIFDLDRFIRQNIIYLFNKAAVELGATIDNPEEAAAIPLAMFEAQEYMLNAWKQFLAMKAVQK